jgi:hypothetical protein
MEHGLSLSGEAQNMGKLMQNIVERVAASYTIYVMIKLQKKTYFMLDLSYERLQG